MQRRCSAFAWFVATLVALWCSAFAVPARAYEDQLSLDLAVGYGRLAPSDRLGADKAEQLDAPPNMLSVDVGMAAGIQDWLVLRGAIGYGPLVGQHQKTKQSARVRAELMYLVDIVQWVPFFGLGGGLWLIERQNSITPRGAGHLIFGLDYLATRAWTLGVDVRTGFLLGEGKLLSFTEGQLRLSRMFELF